MRSVKITTACALFVALVASQVRASIVNGSFEDGNFTGWDTTGSTSVETGGFGTPPSDGTFHGLMTTLGTVVGGTATSAAELEVFLGMVPGTLTTISDPTPISGAPISGAAIRQTVTVNNGDIIRFDWNFLTNESTPAVDFNDTSFWSLTPGEQGGEELADTFGTFSSSGTVFSEETGYFTTEYTVFNGGTYTLGFGVVDLNDDDDNFPSGLLIDNVRSGAQNVNAVPEPTSLTLWAVAVSVAAARRRRRKRKQ